MHNKQFTSIYRRKTETWVGKKLVWCRSATGQWGRDLKADAIPRCALLTPHFCAVVCTFHSPLLLIHHSSSYDTHKTQLGRHHNHIFNQSGGGGPERWHVVPTHGGLGRAGCEGAPRTAKQTEGGQVAGRASAETRPLPCSPRGVLASTVTPCLSLPLPSSPHLWSPFLHPSI